VRAGNEKPVDWMAAKGLTNGAESPTQQEYVQVDECVFNALVVKRKKDWPDLTKSQRREKVSQQLGYVSYVALKRHHESQCVWNTTQDKRKIRARSRARKDVAKGFSDPKLEEEFIKLKTAWELYQEIAKC
jgi:hypothetical protein